MSARRHFRYFPRKIEFSFNSKITKMLFLFTNYALQNPSVQCVGFYVTFLAFFLLFNMKPNKLKYKKAGAWCMQVFLKKNAITQSFDIVMFLSIPQKRIIYIVCSYVHAYACLTTPTYLQLIKTDRERKIDDVRRNQLLMTS